MLWGGVTGGVTCVAGALGSMTLVMKSFLPIFPIFPKALGDLRRSGILSWRAISDDPRFLFRLRARPRFLLVLLESFGVPLDPFIYFDVGGGFSESASTLVQPAKRIACVIALHKFPEVRRLRLDPATQEVRFRISVFGVHRLWQARWLIRVLNAVIHRWRGRNMPAFAIELIDGLERGVVDGQWGAELRSAALEKHFNHVVSLARNVPAPLFPNTAGAPLVSLIVPIFNSTPAHLDVLLSSVRSEQVIPYELILSDDGSTREETRQWLEAAEQQGFTIIRSPSNQGIAAATNLGVAVARGAWVALLDHDDALAPHTLKIFATEASKWPNARFFYTDEMITDKDLKPVQYFLKPGFDPVLLTGVNYINHLSFFNRERLLRVGGLHVDYQGSQDYDLLLRYLDGLKPVEIIHIPYPGYLWRRHNEAHSATSKEIAVANARRALANYHSLGDGEVLVEAALLPDLHRLRFDNTRSNWPTVSVIIPNRNSLKLISTLLQNLAEKTDYPALEVIIVDNGTTDAEVLQLYQTYRARFASLRLHLHEETFNFSRAVNRGVALASGDYMLLLNNDIEVVDAGWLKEMVSCFAYRDTGIVGARLLYPDRRIQHAGVIVGLGNLAGHWFSRAPERFPGPMGRLAVRQSLTAVTGAAMLVSRACFEATGPFEEERFAIAYNDIDFCLRAGARGFRVVWTPFATLIHHESASRGSDELPENIERFREEQRQLRELYETDRYEDRAFSPWYTRDRSHPMYRFREDLPSSR